MEKSAGLLEMCIFFSYGVILTSFIGFWGAFYFYTHIGKKQAKYGLNEPTNLGVEMNFM